VLRDTLRDMDDVYMVEGIVLERQLVRQANFLDHKAPAI
jgi:hypothetical protein